VPSEVETGDFDLADDVRSDESAPRAAIGPDHQLPAAVPVRLHPKARRIILWTLAGLLVVLVPALILRRVEAAKQVAPPPATIAITAATAVKGSIGVYLDAIGTVTPVYTASITSQVTGRIVAVHYTEGQLLRKGDPLVDIDPRPYQAMLLQAQGALERDQSLLAEAQMDAERYRDAWARNSIAKQTVDDQEKVVLQDEGIVKNDRGTVQYDEVQLDYCHIAAPIAGRVGLRLVDPGNVVQSAGTVTLAVITQIDPITVIFAIPEDNLGEVQARLHTGAKLTVDAFDRTAQTKIGSGTLLTLDNQINTTTGTVQARALFANKTDVFFPNQFVNTRLLVNTLPGVTLIPASTIQQNGQASFVYVIQRDTAHTHTVTLGVTEGGMTQVAGINPGDTVATSGFDKLRDKALVAISSTPARADTGRGTTP
jgi:membrane fusion protein, multidrug efflux system